jgi:hypothetical protein
MWWEAYELNSVMVTEFGGFYGHVRRVPIEHQETFLAGNLRSVLLKVTQEGQECFGIVISRFRARNGCLDSTQWFTNCVRYIIVIS